MRIRNIICVIATTLIIVLFFSSCRTIAGQPSIKKAEILPMEISPGDTAIIQVCIKDKHHLVQKVEAVIKEDPRIKLKLRDDGIDPDKKANDGIWILKVDVPPEAIPGVYKLEIMTYTKNNLPIYIRGREGKVETLKAEIPVILK